MLCITDPGLPESVTAGIGTDPTIIAGSPKRGRGTPPKQAPNKPREKVCIQERRSSGLEALRTDGRSGCRLRFLISPSSAVQSF